MQLKNFQKASLILPLQIKLSVVQRPQQLITGLHAEQSHWLTLSINLSVSSFDVFGLLTGFKIIFFCKLNKDNASDNNDFFWYKFEVLLLLKAI